MRIVMTAAHGGFGSERVPLGGGAAIFERLVASQVFANHELHLLGAGPDAPKGGEYEQLGRLLRAPSALSMTEYARFCQSFGELTTQRTLELKPDVALCHDISEGPDVVALAEAGIKVVTVFHVDVVDIFGRLYLKGMLDPKKLTSLYRRSAGLPWPQVLKLVFQKQQQVMTFGSLCVVPSSGASTMLKRCYPQSPAPILTLGWGVPNCPFSVSDCEEAADKLRAEHNIPANHRVILTLSRLSPEKAQHRLLEAVSFAESQGRMPEDLTIVIAGAPAFMDGERHARRLRRLAQALNTRVLFPGHVGGLEKAAWYSMACLFVVNSLHESYGLTTLEAMQQACPVVAVRSFGTADTVTQDVGRLVLPGPILERRLWGTIEALLQTGAEERLKIMGQRAREMAQNCAFERVAQRLLFLLEKL